MSTFSTQFLIAHEHPSLPGHFPGAPVVPGVVVIDQVLDALRQCTGVRPDRLRLPQVKFVQPLLPGQTADIELTIDGQSARFSVRRDGALIASGAIDWRTPP